MQAFELNNLINIGATDKVRAHLKKLSLKDRLPLLRELIPYVKETPTHLKFFHENFANEIGALIQAGMDYAAAEELYNRAKELKMKKR
jgi:hypothetical protein